MSFANDDRFFKIVNGKNITYSEKENTELKGIIVIQSIIRIETKNKDKNFKLIYPNKNYELAAPSEEIKNQWVTAITELRKALIKCELYPDVASSNKQQKKQFKYVSNRAIEFMVSKFENERFTLKNMNNGEQSELSLSDLIKKLK